MALGDTGKAIGATTEALRLRLSNRTGLTVSVGRPDDPGGGVVGGRLNLFLYEIIFDPSLKNVPLDEGQPAPLWLALKYMLTAFDSAGNNVDSDTVEAMEFLGEGVRALQELNYLTAPAGLDPNYIKAMTPNPEDLKITFDEASPDLLSKLMQGSNDKFHLSVAFEVRPVLIAPAEPRSYSLLVGIDYRPPQTIIGEAGIHIPVLPSMGPTISLIEPESFEAGDTVTVYGTDLHLSGLSVMLGAVELPVTMQRPDRLEFLARPDLLTGDVISAGGQPLTVAQAVSPTRRRRSNVLVGNLLPTINTVIFPVAVTVIAGVPPAPDFAHGTIDLTGVLLGRDDDDVILALYRDGQTVRALDYFEPNASLPGPPPAQTGKRIVMLAGDAVPRGPYNVILRVNGAQAKQSPTIIF
jgi:hypothetical protein